MAEFATGDRDEALDIVQDAMLKLAERYPDRGVQEWAPLFHRILQSRIMDWHRRGKVRRRWRVWLREDDEYRDDPIERQSDPSDPNPARHAADDQLGPALEGALRALPARQQQAFLLRTWEGFDVATTARTMGCSQGSVKTHLSRAMHALRVALADHY